MGRNGFCELWRFPQDAARAGRFFTFLGYHFDGGQTESKTYGMGGSAKGDFDFIGVWDARGLSTRIKIPDLMGGVRGFCDARNIASNSVIQGTSSKFSGCGTSARTFPNDH